jgi:hypothetical protein
VRGGAQEISVFVTHGLRQRIGVDDLGEPFGVEPA